MFYKCQYESPLGTITLACSETGLIGLWISGQKYEYKTLPENNLIEDNDYPILVEAKRWLDLYFAGEKHGIDSLKLDPIGTKFQHDVWDVLKTIPYGTTISYNDIAKLLAKKYKIKKMSAQAVGGAVGHNQISIIISCHRVVGSNGSLTGYAGGIDKKVRLLELEGVDLSKYTIPTKGTAI